MQWNSHSSFMQILNRCLVQASKGVSVQLQCVHCNLLIQGCVLTRGPSASSHYHTKTIYVSRFVYYDFCVTLSILLAVLFNPLCNLLGFCEIVANNY